MHAATCALCAQLGWHANLSQSSHTRAEPEHAMQTVDMAELMEAVSRTRFGVNGSVPGAGMGSGLQRRLWDWVVENLSTGRTVRSLPVSGS